MSIFKHLMYHIFIVKQQIQTKGMRSGDMGVGEWANSMESQHPQVTHIFNMLVRFQMFWATNAF